MSIPEASPPLRADARRNRDAILNAARQVFAEEGLAAPLDRIARLAGVGRATLYRRFPTREVLIQAIFRDNIEQLHIVVNDAGDAPDAFFTILEAALAQQADNLGFIELFTRPPATDEPTPDGVPLTTQARMPWVDLITEPLARAQAAGLVRSDIEPDDTSAVLFMLGAATAALRRREGGGQELRRRVINLALDSITPSPTHRSLDR